MGFHNFISLKRCQLPAFFMYKLKIMQFHLVLALICLSSQLNAQRPYLKIATNSNIEYQTMDGFGASDTWRAQFIGKNWPLEKREYIADLLFSQVSSDCSGLIHDRAIFKFPSFILLDLFKD